MEINIRKTFSVWIVIGILLIYGLYLGYNILAFSILSFQFLFSLLPLMLSFASVIGLFLNKSWSKYCILCLSIFISLFWIYTVFAYYSKNSITDRIGEILISLIPGGLMLVLCFGCAIIVFRYFKTIKKET
jgi:hypothetical protein